MSALPIGQWLRRPIVAVSQWWKTNWARSADHAELKCCAEEEVERLAREVGVSPPELRKLVSASPDATELLYRRMAALDLDRKEVSSIAPRTFRDLQRACVLCEHRRQCVRDLGRDTDDPVWEEYCPNVTTLKALDAMPWRARNGG